LCCGLGRHCGEEEVQEDCGFGVTRIRRFHRFAFLREGWDAA
jgi:hypothetical protein